MPVRAPLRWYLRRYRAALRREIDVARDVALAHAAKHVGSGVLDRTLAECRVVDIGWDLFWNERARPALDRGLHPPLATGFRTWAHHEGLDADTEQWPAGGDDALVAEAALLEPALLARVASDLHVADLVRAGWDDVAPEAVEAVDRPPSALRTFGLPFSTRLATPPRTRVAAAALLAFIVLSLGAMTAIFVQLALDPIRPGTEWLLWLFAALSAVAMVMLARPQLDKVLHPGRVRSDGHMLVVEHRRLLRRPFAVPLERVRAISLDRDGDLRFAVYDDSPWRVPLEGGAEPLAYLWASGGSPLPLIDLTPDPPNVAVVLAEPVLAPQMRRTPLHGPLNRQRVRGFLLRVDSPERFLDSGAVRDLRLEDLGVLDVRVG